MAVPTRPLTVLAILASTLAAAVALAESAPPGPPDGGTTEGEPAARPDGGTTDEAAPEAPADGEVPSVEPKPPPDLDPAEIASAPPRPAPPDPSFPLPARLPDGRPLDLRDHQRWVFVDKSERVMIVHTRSFHEVFRVALGPSPEGDKEVEGDGRTPEGLFYVCQRIAADRFRRFLGLSYPGPEDGERGALAGLLQPIEVRAIERAFRRQERPPWNTALGGNVGIHGWGRRRHIEELHALGKDWTDGCIGVTNDEIERIHAVVRTGTRVVIVP